MLVVQCHKYSSNKLKLLLQHGQYTCIIYALQLILFIVIIIIITLQYLHCPIGFKTQIKASISCHSINFILHFII